MRSPSSVMALCGAVVIAPAPAAAGTPEAIDLDCEGDRYRIDLNAKYRPVRTQRRRRAGQLSSDPLQAFRRGHHPRPNPRRRAGPEPRHDHWTCDGPTPHRQPYRHSVTEAPDAYSGGFLFDGHRSTTPTLIMVGDEAKGATDPLSSEVLFSLLRTTGTPTRLLRYPDGGHNPGSDASALHRFQQVEAWLNRYAPGGPS